MFATGLFDQTPRPATSNRTCTPHCSHMPSFISLLSSSFIALIIYRHHSRLLAPFASPVTRALGLALLHTLPALHSTAPSPVLSLTHSLTHSRGAALAERLLRARVVVAQAQKPTFFRFQIDFYRPYGFKLKAPLYHFSPHQSLKTGVVLSS